MFVHLNSFQGLPGIWFLVACAWKPDLFKGLMFSQLLILKLPVQGLLVVQIFMFLVMLLITCRRSSRLWGLLSSGGHKPLRSLLQFSVSQVLAKILAL